MSCSLAEVSDSEEEEGGEGERGTHCGVPTYAEEQEQLKEDFKGAVVELEEEEGGDGEDVLTLRKKTRLEKVRQLYSVVYGVCTGMLCARVH